MSDISKVMKRIFARGDSETRNNHSSLDFLEEKIRTLAREIFLLENGIQPDNDDGESLESKQKRLADLESAFNCAHG